MNSMILAALMTISTAASAQTGIDVRVVGVSDGDTIRVLTADKKSFRVRLSDIDAPESSQAFGQRSKKALSDICFGKKAVVTVDQTDQYGRVLSRVACDGVDTQAYMVSAGMAWVYDRYVSDKSLYGLQEQAKSQGRGLWTDPNPTPPWEFRRKK